MRMMLFGEISSRIDSGARWRRQRLRSAIATAFFASRLPDDVAIELGDDLPRREVGEPGERLLRAIRWHDRCGVQLRASL